MLIQFLALAISAPLQLAPSPDLRGEIEVPMDCALAFSPAGDLWLGTDDGRLYVCRAESCTWSEVRTPTRRDDGATFTGDRLTLLRFFDAERAVLAGAIGGGTQDEVLRTEDGGATWTVAKLPHELRAYDLAVLPDGHAWLVGSTRELLTSDDFGASWRVAGAPFETYVDCVDLVEPDVGFVGGRDVLKWTEDAGLTWQDVPLPDLPMPEDRRPRITSVWIVGHELFALVSERLYRKPANGAGIWTPVEVEGRAICAATASYSGLLAVTEDLRVVEILGSGEARALCDTALERRPVEMTRHGDTSALLLPRGPLCRIERGSLTCLPFHTEGPGRSWPITAFDRAKNGTWFGVSKTALYRSTDSGATWERLIESAGMGGAAGGYTGISGVCAFADGSGAVVVTDDGISLWTEERSELEVVLGRRPRERRLGFQGRCGALLVATSFATDGSPGAEQMLRQSDTVLRGAGFTALVYASADEGRTWREIDRAAGAIVHAAWLGDDHVLSLHLSDGSIRAGQLDAATGSADARGFRTLATEPKGLGGSWASWLAFPEPSVGIVGGNYYFGDAVTHRSQDGGVTWWKLETAESTVMQSYRLGGGSCARIVGFWHDESRIEIWRGGAFEPVRTFEPGVHDAYVDTGGRLLLRLRDASVWSLSAEASEWSRLGTIGLPLR